MVEQEHILFLDGPVGTSKSISIDGVLNRFKVTSERDWGNKDEYTAPRHFLDRVTRETTNEDFKLIIVGNNHGAGIKKVKAVHPRLRSKVVIVFFNPRPTADEQAEYLALGCSIDHFMYREELAQKIEHLLELA